MRRCSILLLPVAAVVLVVACHWLAPAPISEALHSALFERAGDSDCVPETVTARGPALPARPVSGEEIEAFRRDGFVVLRGVISAEWLGYMRALARGVTASPNRWDLLYSIAVAKFYKSQKSILLHHTSRCGKQIGVFAPTTGVVAALLGSSQLRACEPNMAILSLGENGGNVNTGWHTDAEYMPIRRRNMSQHALVRIWIPLEPFTDDMLYMKALNNSHTAKKERQDVGFTIDGPNFEQSSRLEREHGDLVARHRLGPNEYSPGDVLAFAEDTPHVASVLNCTKNTCARLLLSYAGDNAVFSQGKLTSMLPMGDGQTDGEPLRGPQFPKVYPSIDAKEWGSFRPSCGQIARAMAIAVFAGGKSFLGSGVAVVGRYVLEVAFSTLRNAWVVPGFDEDVPIKFGLGMAMGGPSIKVP